MEGFLMRVNISKTKNFEFVYIIKDFYNDKNSRTTKIFEKLGKMEDLCNEKNMTRDEVISWAKQRAIALTQKENDEKEDTVISFSPVNVIKKDSIRQFNCGYLFLQKLYYQLKLDNVCRNIKSKYKFDYDIDAILSDLIYTRILSPSSKKASYEFSKHLLEAPKYELHDIYRALSILSKENEYIQSELYKNSHFIKNRNTSALYYDCTNFYFEIEEDDDLRKYGKSKENRPNPIVGMGLMMDGDGLPLAFDIYAGNKNEQVTLKPLETRIIRDFELSKFIYCSDAGLASQNNKRFNSTKDRAYIITQSLKKLKKEDNDVALRRDGFYVLGSHSKNTYNIDNIDFSKEKNMNIVFYKEIPLEKPVSERLIVTFSPKYAAYQKNIREKQIQRAMNMVTRNGKIKKQRKNPNDPARFLYKTTTNEKGEIIDETYNLNIEAINEEARYDGFYAITTNLEDDDVKSIISVSERRWQIEECFRIMKTDFKSRPVHVSLEDHILAHFLTCFISLLIYRLLADKLNNKYTINELLNTIRNMNIVDTDYNGYIPAYTRTDITDSLHTAFGFRTDYEIISKKKMRNIIKNTKIK